MQPKTSKRPTSRIETVGDLGDRLTQAVLEGVPVQASRSERLATDRLILFGKLSALQDKYKHTRDRLCDAVTQALKSGPHDELCEADRQAAAFLRKIRSE